MSRNDAISKEVVQGHYYLASASRDRIIHLYNVERYNFFYCIPTFRSVFLMLLFFHVRNFDLTDSIVDHSAAVTSVKISCNGHKIISCSADRYNRKSFTLCAHNLFDIGNLLL